MNSERLIKMVMMDYTSDILKIEEELEKTINGDLEINRKVQKIKDLLSLMVTTETSLSKFTSMMTNNNNNNTD